MAGAGKLIELTVKRPVSAECGKRVLRATWSAAQLDRAAVATKPATSKFLSPLTILAQGVLASNSRTGSRSAVPVAAVATVATVFRNPIGHEPP
jgi:hypothetical protein